MAHLMKKKVEKIMENKLYKNLKMIKSILHELSSDGRLKSLSTGQTVWTQIRACSGSKLTSDLIRV